MAFQDFIEDGKPFVEPNSSAASDFRQESPSSGDLLANNVTSGFTRKAGSFVAENTIGAVDYASNTFGLDLPQAQKLSAQDINSMAPIGNDGKQTHITDTPLPENVANMLIKDKQRELVNQDMTSRYRNANGLLPTFAVGAASFIADPSDLAATAYGGAILGGSKVLTGLGVVGLDTAATATRLAARGISGAVGGAASMTPLAAAQLGISQYQNGDYDTKAALSDLAFGAAFGAVGHAGFGIAAEKGLLRPDALMREQSLKTDFQTQAEDIIRQPAPVKAAAINSTIADVVNGRPVNTEAVIGRDGNPPNVEQMADDRTRQNAEGYSPSMTSEEIQAAKKAIIPEGIKVQPQPSRLAPEIIDRYQKIVADELAKKGLAGLDDNIVRETARIMAESHNPVEPTLPRTLAEVENGTGKRLNPFERNPEEVKQAAIGEAAKEAAPQKPPVLQEKFPKLPRELAGAKSGYKKAVPQFESDVDKALYVVREKSSVKSKSHDQYMDFLKNTVGLSDGEIRKGSQDVYNKVREHAEGVEGKIAVPTVFKRTGIELSAEDIAANKKAQALINRSIAAKNKKLGAPKNIIESIAKAGGMKDEEGWLKKRDMRGVFTQHGRLYTKDGMDYGAALQHAIDNKWIEKGEYDPNNPAKLTHDDLLNALEKEHFKDKVGEHDHDDHAEQYAGELGIDTTSMEPKEIHAAIEARLKEHANERDFVEELGHEEFEAAHDYYPDMEEHYADEATHEGSHTEREPEVGASHERSESEAGNKGRGEGAEPINTSVAGRGAEGTEANGRAASADSKTTTFEPVRNVVGATEQGVLGGMEQSAKQAMEARGEKISAKVDQKPANEGLFGSVIGGGDELDLRIADAEKTINTDAMTSEEKAELQEIYKQADEADKIYSDKMQDLAQCFKSEGV